MLLTFTLLIVGFVALIMGANWLVDGATSVGIRAKLSPLIIGLTIVAFGTSLPELIVNIFSCAKGSSGLAIGNIIGSNTMNILLILGVSAMIYPIDVNNISIKRDIPSCRYSISTDQSVDKRRCCCDGSIYGCRINGGCGA